MKKYKNNFPDLIIKYTGGKMYSRIARVMNHTYH
jgi:hypothetical protein